MGLQSYFIDLCMFSLMPVPHHLDYHSLVVSFEIGLSVNLHLCSFSLKMVWASGSIEFPYKFEDQVVHLGQPPPHQQKQPSQNPKLQKTKTQLEFGKGWRWIDAILF